MKDSNRPLVSRRRVLELTGATGVAGLAGCSGSGGGDGGDGGDGGGSDDESGDGGGDQTSTDSSDTASPIEMGFSTYFRGGAWITAFLEATEFYAEDQNFDYNEFGNQESAEQQVSDIRQMANQGYDGILINTWNSEAVNPAIEDAVDQGVPVFTANVDATTDAVTMFVAFSNEAAGADAADQMMTELEEEKPDQDSYEILEVFGAPAQQIAQQRSKGFVDTIESTDNAEIVDTVEGEFTRDAAQTAVSEWVNANGAPDAIYSSNLSMGLGVVTALDNQGELAQRGEDGHVVLVQLDAGPEVITNIDDGYVDAAIDQPNYFYGPIALEYMRRYVEGDGEDEIPEVGTTVTEDDLTIEQAQHKDVELWSEPVWAPAEIVEKDGHVQFQTSSVIVTEENANEPYLWGNIWG
ncbi:sugar ABC transporter substrate-binding protein [Halobellus rufus]|uniref:sugar ABC transporter substrate-binding protein n=1 Tax=Halobellus rufus TaxID=1448860 RepID=UPI0012E01AD8|nr:sugar ABC transporter substrate-binding protein [Halobellus rufus]